MPQLQELGVYGLKVASNDLVSYIRIRLRTSFSSAGGPAIVGLFNKADSLQDPRIVAGSVYNPVFRSLAKIRTTWISLGTSISGRHAVVRIHDPLFVVWPGCATVRAFVYARNGRHRRASCDT